MGFAITIPTYASLMTPAEGDGPGLRRDLAQMPVVDNTEAEDGAAAM